jgi:hypothetical protein
MAKSKVNYQKMIKTILSLRQFFKVKMGNMRLKACLALEPHRMSTYAALTEIRKSW